MAQLQPLLQLLDQVWARHQSRTRWWHEELCGQERPGRRSIRWLPWHGGIIPYLVRACNRQGAEPTW